MVENSSTGCEIILRILICDDDPLILQLLHRFLTDKGFQVACTENGEEVLRKLQEYNPHLVLLDLNMPNKDGLEVLKEIKEKRRDTGVIIVSGNQERERALKTLELGAFDYVVKPIDFDYLVNSIRAWQVCLPTGRQVGVV